MRRLPLDFETNYFVPPEAQRLVTQFLTESATHTEDDRLSSLKVVFLVQVILECLGDAPLKLKSYFVTTSEFSAKFSEFDC